MLNTFKLAWHFHQQNKAASHQRFLRYCYILLMVFIVTLGQTSGSIQRNLQSNLEHLLGADAVLISSQALTNSQLAQLKQQSQTVVQTQQVKTTITANGKWQATSLKAVGDNYPLQGAITTKSSLAADAQASDRGPNVGNIWLDARLISSLSLNVGEKITLANQLFTVTKILEHEPDRLMEGHNVSMRALIHQDSFQQLNINNDLVQNRYLMQASKSQISTLVSWQKTELPAAQLMHKSGAHPLARFWQRTENFIGLTSIVLFFMAAIAIAQLTKIQRQSEQRFAAVGLSLGASKTQVLTLSVIQWGIGLVMVLPIVMLVSMALHLALLKWLSSAFAMFDFSGLSFANISSQWRWRDAVKSIFAMSAIFFVFHSPIWLALKNSNVRQLFQAQRFNVNQSIKQHLEKGYLVVILGSITALYSDNGLLTAMVIGSIIASLLLLVVLSYVSLIISEKLSQNRAGLLPFSLFMMRQRLTTKSTQIIGVGLSVFLLLFTLMLLRDLGNTMTAYQRQYDGNVMVSQASEEQLHAIESLARDTGLSVRQSKPYVYAKLIEVNQQPLEQFSGKPSDSLATLAKEVRLHPTPNTPLNNRVVEGQWWTKTSSWQQISVEQEVMTDIGLSLGDKLTLAIGNQTLNFTIVASHVYRPGYGSITFWLQVPERAMAHINASTFAMASLEVDKAQWAKLSQLWQQYPTLRMVSLQEITARFDAMLDLMSRVITGFSLLIILFAALVIVASVHTFEADDKKKNSIILSFGFSRRTCLQLNIIEWFITAVIAAIGAVGGTYLAGVLIYQAQFSLKYQPNISMLVMTLCLILTAVTSFGIYASRRNLSCSVKQLMEEV